MQKKDLDNGITKDEFKTLDQIKRELKGEDDESKKLLELLDNLTATVEQEEYKENDGNHTNDTQTIAITNKLSGTKSIEFHKQWNDIYAFDSGKRPDLYLTLYQLTGDNLITEYREYHWDKSLQTEEGEGGQQGQGEETEEPPQEGGTETQAQDNYYWTCIFENLPKYDENGNEIFYYAVENLAVTDPSTFHYAKPEFQYNNQEVEVEYGEDGKVALPDNNTDKQTGQEILKVVGDKVALLENGTFLNNLEEDVTINGVKLWANLPLTASEADLPGVTFNVYQHSSDENGDSVENGTLVAQLAIEDWSKLPPEVNKSGNQYTFTIDEVTVDVEGLNKGDPLPLYDAKGNRYIYKLVENLGKEGEDQNVDWTLVYHNDTFNEYQITNTYDPQLGALSVKKLLEVEPYQEHYPSIRFRLYQVAPDSAGKYDEQNAVLYREESWSSEDVEKAIGNTPSVLTTEAQRVVVEKTFTFENLPIYAPNGEKYQYFVAEILDDGSGYEMNYEAAVKEGSHSTVEEVFNGGKTETTEIVTEEDGTEIITIVLETEPIEVTPNENWDHENDGTVPTSLSVSNTFGDKYIPETISLTGTKVWNDQGDALGLRPSEEDFEKNVKLYRYAEPQEGQYNGIAEQEVALTVDQWDWTTEDDTWSYTINNLEQYAPNGMPWIYIVRENLNEMGAEEYIPTNQKTVDGDKIGEVSSDKGTQENQTITMPPLTNTLTTTQSFKKQWQNHDGGSITEDYLGLGDITITGQLWVGEKDADGNVSNMQKASEYFTSENGWIGPDKWWDEKPTFTVDLKTQLGDNDQTATISNLPRVNKDSKELVYAIVEEKISLGNGYSQEFSWNYADGKLTVTEQKPQNCLFTPQEVTVNENSSTTTAINSLETKNLSVEKLWKGDENETNLRPLSVDVVVQRKVRQEGGNQSEQADELTRATLMAPRTTEDGWEFVPNGDDKYLTETLEEATGWKASIPNLPSYGVQDGALVTYEYRIRELRSGWQDDDILNEDDILKAGDKYNPYYTVSYDDNAHTVTNTLTHMDIIAVKEWKPGTLTGENAKVIFTLQSRVGDGEWTNVDEKQTIELDGTPDQDGEFEAWKARWTELPRTDSSGAAIEYLIKETLASDLIENEHVTILYPEKGITGSTADKTYTVTNIPLGQITVTKEDGDGNGLAGVEFTLNSDSGTPMPLVGKTGEDGKLTFTELPLYDEQTGEPITYTLTESATPDGHIRLEQPIEVSFTAQEKPVDGIYWQTTDGFLLHEVAYEVVNGQYFPVVHTGGSGFYWPGVLGAGAAAAGVLYLIRRKTKGHNTER